MTLTEQINADFMTAYKAKDFALKNFLGLLKSEITTESLKENGLSPLQIVKKMEKSLKENSSDLSATTELGYLAPYLPQLMLESEVETIVSTLIGNGVNNLGLVMKEFNTKYQGKADNNVVKNVFTRLTA
jgi:uncharacterized protein YqeY